ncbi:MAG: DsbA family oxidoreductase [Parvularculaceae bacterium]|nr:DsbA family oxidoreductase [Parvularculaceae bacterium]
MNTNRATVRVDIVSDVVCPWCAIGYYQLAAAARETAVELDVHWHPFELNPYMRDGGENLREHLAGKYGTTPAGSKRARARLTALGAELGFTFNYADDMRMFNTFRAHQLVDWAETQGKSHDTKMALFEAFFTHRQDVSDFDELARVAASVGLDEGAARGILESGERAQSVREKQSLWLERGIQGVPTMVFQGRHAVTGAQGVDQYGAALRQAVAA